MNNTNDNNNRADFFIASIPLNSNNIGNSYINYSSRFPEIENIIYNNQNYWDIINKTLVNSSRFYLGNGSKSDFLEISSRISNRIMFVKAR